VKITIKCKKLNNQGSALVTTLVVSLVVTALVLSLLLVAYSLFSSVNDKNFDFEARELAESTMAEIDRELTCNYVNFGELQQAVAEGDNPYYTYVRCNMGTGSWINYDSVAAGHSLSDENVCKYFQIDVKEGSSADPEELGNAARKDVLPATVKVTMYWERDAAMPIELDSGIEDKYKGVDGALLYVVVDVSYKNASYSVKHEYSLDVIEVQGLDEGGSDYVFSGGFNPAAYSISSNRMWIWSALRE